MSAMVILGAKERSGGKCPIFFCGNRCLDSDAATPYISGTFSYAQPQHTGCSNIGRLCHPTTDRYIVACTVGHNATDE